MRELISGDSSQSAYNDNHIHVQPLIILCSCHLGLSGVGLILSYVSVFCLKYDELGNRIVNRGEKVCQKV